MRQTNKNKIREMPLRDERRSAKRFSGGRRFRAASYHSYCLSYNPFSLFRIKKGRLPDLSFGVSIRLFFCGVCLLRRGEAEPHLSMPSTRHSAKTDIIYFLPKSL